MSEVSTALNAWGAEQNGTFAETLEKQSHGKNGIDPNTLGPGDAAVLNRGLPTWFGQTPPPAAPAGRPGISVRTVAIAGIAMAALVGVVWWSLHRR